MRYGRAIIVEKRRRGSYRNKVAVIGFPGMALIGKGVADFIAATLGLEVDAFIHPVHSPPNVAVEGGRIVAPLITVYGKKNSNVVVITSAFQPQSDEGQNEVAHVILEYLSEKEVDGVISAAAYVTSTPSKPRKVYVASSDKSMLERLVSLGAIPMEGGISGLNGLIPGLAHLYGIPGAALLGETGEAYVANNLIDYLGISSVVTVIGRAIGISFNVAELVEKGEEIENRLLVSLARAAEVGERAEKPPAPTHL